MHAGMGITDFSTADQWAPLARAALAKQRRRESRLAAQPLADLAAIASPLRLTV